MASQEDQSSDFHTASSNIHTTSLPTLPQAFSKITTNRNKLQVSDNMLYVNAYLSLHFNVHFPSESRLAGFIEARMMEVVVTTGAISRAKLHSNRHHPQTNTQLFTGRMPFLSPSQQCQSTEGKISHSMDLPQAHLGSSNFVSDE